MSSLSLALPVSAPSFNLPRWRGHVGAAGIAVALHAALAVVLLGHDYTPRLPTPVVPVITTQLISLPPSAPVEPLAPPLAVPEPAAAIEPPPPPPQVLTPPAPVPPSAAELAFKREQQREADVRRQERVAEQQRRRDEARQREDQARAQQEQAAREAAEVRETQRLATERRAADERARAAAASSQYLPISKQAPDYPQRALDKGVQGDCTVSYTVDTSGRVRDPRVLDGCHPWFAQPSLQAARTFKYQPRVVDGRVVEVPGVKNTFHYSIEQGVR
ncbi:energy transducer TonB [Pseudomonas sp. 5P_5.1_Bac1]|uniref:energy transducer TonB n=1 Tax=Pseudomonas sp. 5P_5.1_Bac1 TaxID=2971616 RepID=UPI0021C82427|nr:energy transducer TonB [Pseudomonas sp. 5P_5.1_Bac1]MCU1725178.1 energy transducer TonB [Pseudomonas sp. 5P_5.1_Bac1]